MLRFTLADRPGARSPVAPRGSNRRPHIRSVAAGSLVGSALACALVGAFVGVMGWKLAESIAIRDSIVGFERPDITAVPQPPAGPFRDLALAELLRRQIPSGGVVGIYTKNLTSGAEAEVNAHRVFAAASLYKLPVLADVVRQSRAGRINLDQPVTVGREHWVPGSGVLQARIGESIPVRELLRLLIVESDNIAAMRLLDLVGLMGVNQSMRELGLDSTRLKDWRAPGAYDGLGPYVTTAHDMGRLLEIIASGGLGDAIGSEQALRLLESKQARQWLADGVSSSSRVAHKWGELPGSRHDAGIVFTPTDQYILVVLTEGLDADFSGDYIRTVSRAVFGYFENGE